MAIPYKTSRHHCIRCILHHARDKQQPIFSKFYAGEPCAVPDPCRCRLHSTFFYFGEGVKPGLHPGRDPPAQGRQPCATSIYEDERRQPCAVPCLCGRRPATSRQPVRRDAPRAIHPMRPGRRGLDHRPVPAGTNQGMGSTDRQDGEAHATGIAPGQGGGQPSATVPPRPAAEKTTIGKNRHVKKKEYPLSRWTDCTPPGGQPGHGVAHGKNHHGEKPPRDGMKPAKEKK